MIIWTTNEADYPDHSFLYVSKLGDDSNAGTRAAPLLTIGAAITKAEADAGYVTKLTCIVIGSGIWGEVLASARTKAYKFIGEASCVFNGLVMLPNLKDGEHLVNVKGVDFSLYENGWNSGATTSGNGVTLKNVTADFIVLASSNPGYFYLENVISDYVRFRRASSSSTAMYADISNCLIKYLHLTRDSGYNVNFNILNFYNNIVGEVLTELAGNAFVQSSGAFFDFNNFYGNKFTVEGTEHTFETYTQLFLLGANGNSFALDPKWKNEAVKDYSLRSDSPCLFTGRNGQSIGPLSEGVTVYGYSDVFRKVSGAEFSQSYILASLEDDILVDNETGEFYLEDDHDTGVVVSPIIDLSVVRLFQKIKSEITLELDVDGKVTDMPLYYDFRFEAYFSTKKYYEGDSCTAGGTKYVCIKDYPTESPFVEYPPASSPTYWDVSTIETATNVSPNIAYRYGNTALECDSADYLVMPLNGDFKVDASGKGSADPDYDPATGVRVRAVFQQFKIKLKSL